MLSIPARINARPAMSLRQRPARLHLEVVGALRLHGEVGGSAVLDGQALADAGLAKLLGQSRHAGHSEGCHGCYFQIGIAKVPFCFESCRGGCRGIAQRFGCCATRKQSRRNRIHRRGIRISSMRLI